MPKTTGKKQREKRRKRKPGGKGQNTDEENLQMKGKNWRKWKHIFPEKSHKRKTVGKEGLRGRNATDKVDESAKSRQRQHEPAAEGSSGGGRLQRKTTTEGSHRRRTKPREKAAKGSKIEAKQRSAAAESTERRQQRTEGGKGGKQQPKAERTKGSKQQRRKAAKGSMSSETGRQPFFPISRNSGLQSKRIEGMVLSMTRGHLSHVLGVVGRRTVSGPRRCRHRKENPKEGVRCRRRLGSNRSLLMCRQPAGPGEQGQRQLQMGIHPGFRRRHQHRALKIIGWTSSPGPGPVKPEDRGEHRHREPNEVRRAR